MKLACATSRIACVNSITAKAQATSPKLSCLSLQKRVGFFCVAADMFCLCCDDDWQPDLSYAVARGFTEVELGSLAARSL